jgi:SAM-dependent methyltransferase
MNIKHLKYLCCPSCKNSLTIDTNTEIIIEGLLKCSSCFNSYKIKNGIPRFVENSDYADSFSLQWTKYNDSQYDSEMIKESEIRFKSETNIKYENVNEKIVIDVGCGPGRFIDIVIKSDPKLLIAFDISNAIDSAYNKFNIYNNILFIQADIFNCPIKKGLVDVAYSIGVIHHTPDPYVAFNNIKRIINENGYIYLSLYENILYNRKNCNSIYNSFYEVMWAINMLRAELLRNLINKIPNKVFLLYCNYFIPILYYINKIPILKYIRHIFPSTIYNNLPIIYSKVDTFDSYATKIVHQYRHKDIFYWFTSLGLDEISIHNGRDGWVSMSARVPSIEVQEKNIKTHNNKYKKPFSPGLNKFN